MKKIRNELDCLENSGVGGTERIKEEGDRILRCLGRWVDYPLNNILDDRVHD